MRRLAKTVVERGLLRLTRAGAIPRDRSERRAVLAYHNVLPDEHARVGEQSLHVSLSKFRSHLDALQEWCAITDLRGLLMSDPGQWDRPAVAITFDDGYRGALTLAARELEGRHIPGTFFVCPGAVGARAFWWDQVGAASGGEIPPQWRAHALDSLGGDGSTILGWAAHRATPADAVPPLAAPCDLRDLRDLVRWKGMVVASHSWSHRNLTTLSGPTLAEELQASHRWLAQFGASYLPMLAYPYGCWSPVVARAAEDTGYVAALRIEGSLFRAPVERMFAVPRMNVPSGLSAEGLILRVLGLRRA